MYCNQVGTLQFDLFAAAEFSEPRRALLDRQKTYFPALAATFPVRSGGGLSCRWAPSMFAGFLNMLAQHQLPLGHGACSRTTEFLDLEGAYLAMKWSLAMSYDDVDIETI